MAWPKPNQLGGARQWFLAFLCVPALLQAGPRLVDRSVALIDGRVLTLSELTFETRVLFVTRGGVGAAFDALDLSALKVGLDHVIGERLELAEADKLNAYQLEEGELERAIGLFSDRLGGAGELERFLHTHEADRAMLDAVLTRMLRTQRVLTGKLKLKAQVSEAEARNLVADRPELKGLPLALAREKLSAERFGTMAAAELAQVRKNGSVRLLGPFAETLRGDGGVRLLP